MRIKELVRYRKNGITRTEDCQEFDSLRHEQDKLKENKADSEGGASLSGDWPIETGVWCVFTQLYHLRF